MSISLITTEKILINAIQSIWAHHFNLYDCNALSVIQVTAGHVSSDSYEAEKLSDVCSKLELLINIYYWHGTINSALITLHYFPAIAEIIAFFYFIELKSLLLNGKYHHSSKFSICLLFYVDYLWNAQFCDFHSIISKFNSSHLKYS